MNSKFLAFGVAGALIYMGVSGTLGNPKLGTAALALGTIIAAKQTPFLNTMV